jgi:hypothetical protein
MELAIRIMAAYTILAAMAFIGLAIWQVGETREHGRLSAVLTFIALCIVIIFAILVLLNYKGS